MRHVFVVGMLAYLSFLTIYAFDLVRAQPATVQAAFFVPVLLIGIGAVALGFHIVRCHKRGEVMKQFVVLCMLAVLGAACGTTPVQPQGRLELSIVSPTRGSILASGTSQTITVTLCNVAYAGPAHTRSVYLYLRQGSHQATLGSIDVSSLQTDSCTTGSYTWAAVGRVPNLPGSLPGEQHLAPGEYVLTADVWQVQRFVTDPPQAQAETIITLR